MYAGQFEVENVLVDFHPVIELANWSHQNHVAGEDGHCRTCGPGVPVPCNPWGWAETILDQLAPLPYRVMTPKAAEAWQVLQRIAEAFARYGRIQELDYPTAGAGSPDGSRSDG